MMHPRWILPSLILGLSVPLLAQERPKEPEPRPERRMRVWVGDEDLTGRLMPLVHRKARLGVVVALDARDSDSLGAFLQSVTPGGPAARAGLRSGDVVTRLDGQSLLAGSNEKIREGSSEPGLRLVELAAKLEPDDTISIEYVRGGTRRTVSLVTGDEPIVALDDDAFRFRFPEQELEWRMPGLRLERVPGPTRIEVENPRVMGDRIRVFFGGPLSELELAPMNADLSWYFGTGEGVLVLRVNENSTLGLRPGDVVTSVDGRKVSNPASLLRILRSYESGESFRLEVMRQKQRQTVTGQLESRRPG